MLCHPMPLWIRAGLYWALIIFPFWGCLTDFCLPIPPSGMTVTGFLLGTILEVGLGAQLGQLQVTGSHLLFPTWPGAFSPKGWELFHFLLSFS